MSMDEKIYLQAQELKETISKDSRIIHLNELEQKMNNNEEVMALAYKKDMAALEYGDLLNHFSEESDEVKTALKKLHNAKLELDNHPLVKDYLKAYKEVRDLYGEINSVLFSNFAADLCPKEK